MAGDADGGHARERLAVHLDDRHQANVGGAGGDAPGALAGDGELQIDGVVLRSVGHSIDQGRRVQKADRANFGLVQEWDPRIQL